MFEHIDEIVNDWKQAEPTISELFKERQKNQAKEHMVYQINEFKKALLFLNEKEVIENFSSVIDDLDYKPINLEERLSFMELRPNHYHSFIQLKECYQELEKLKAKVMIRKRK